MKKHKKILKNFNFPKMVEKARREHPDLNQRIERFNLWKTHYLSFKYFKYNIIWNKDKYCFELKREFLTNEDWLFAEDSTECTKKYIGNYIYKDFAAGGKHNFIN